MFGLCFLAAMLAEKRAGYGGLYTRFGQIRLATKRYARQFPGCVPASAEYYDILDRLSRGERP